MNADGRGLMVHHRGTEDTEGTYFFLGWETTSKEKMPLKKNMAKQNPSL